MRIDSPFMLCFKVVTSEENPLTYSLPLFLCISPRPYFLTPVPFRFYTQHYTQYHKLFIIKVSSTVKFLSMESSI